MLMLMRGKSGTVRKKEGGGEREKESGVKNEYTKTSARVIWASLFP